MVSHKWFAATCRCMSGVRPVWVIGDVVLPGASSCRQARLVRLTQGRCREKERAFWRRQEGGDWASVDEAGLDVWMYGWIVVAVSPKSRLVYPRRSHSVHLPHSEGEDDGDKRLRTSSSSRTIGRIGIRISICPSASRPSQPTSQSGRFSHEPSSRGPMQIVVAVSSG